MNSLERATKLLSIIEVNLRASKISTREGIDFVNQDETVTQSFRKVTGIKETDLVDEESKVKFWLYRIAYTAGIRLILENEEEKSLEKEFQPLLEIVANFESSYTSKEQLSEEELEAFKVNNVGFHVWPYWREYVQSTCSKIGISPVLRVPLYRITKKENSVQEEKKIIEEKADT